MTNEPDSAERPSSCPCCPHLHQLAPLHSAQSHVTLHEALAAPSPFHESIGTNKEAAVHGAWPADEQPSGSPTFLFED